METQKTYSLKKALTYSVIVALGFTLLTYLVSLTLGRFRATLLPDAGASWYYWNSRMWNCGLPLPPGVSISGTSYWYGGCFSG